MVQPCQLFTFFTRYAGGSQTGRASVLSADKISKKGHFLWMKDLRLLNE